MRSGNSSTPTVSDPMKAAAEDRGTFRRLLGSLRPHLGSVALIGLLILIVDGTALLKPWVIKILTDDFLIPGRLSNDSGFPVWGLSLLYVALMLLGMAAFYLQVLLITRVGQLIARKLRQQVFRTIQLLPLSYLDRHGSGGLITRSTNDVEAVSELFSDVLVSLVKDLVLLIGIVAAMLSMNVRLSLWALLVVPPMAWLVFYIRRKIHENWIELKKITSRLNGFIAENVSGMKIVQLFNGQKEKFLEFADLNEAYFQRSLLQMKLHSFSGPSANVFESVATAILLFVGMKMLNQGEVGLGDIIGLTLYIRQFFVPVADLADSFTSIESAIVSAQRIFEITDLAEITEDLEEGEAVQEIRGEIEFINVWFAYEGEDWILRDVSFHVRPGETCAIIGETGSGKTTIISLISRFYEIQRGRILIDGRDIRTLRKSDLRRRISVVLQDVFQFSGTVEENITLNDAVEEKIMEEAMEKSQAGAMLRTFRKWLAEPVMERGATLSMGQRQLISFARALAHDPSIFVLDEATANIDTRTEQVIQKAIDEIARERTTIIIAHRLSTIRKADLILVLADGSIIERGDHESLMAEDTVYRSMVNKGGSVA